VRTVKNEEITVPNSTVLSSNTTNFSALAADKGLILHTTVTIGYDVPWRDMHAALLQAAERTELILKEPAPFVLQTSLDDFYVSYQLNAYTRAASQQAQVYSELHRHILDSCAEAGIEIMSPHYRAMRDGNASTIPSSGNIPQ
jgi:small-conductance mechanosensitive channel